MYLSIYIYILLLIILLLLYMIIYVHMFLSIFWAPPAHCWLQSCGAACWCSPGKLHEGSFTIWSIGWSPFCLIWYPTCVTIKFTINFQSYLSRNPNDFPLIDPQNYQQNPMTFVGKPPKIPMKSMRSTHCPWRICRSGHTKGTKWNQGAGAISRPCWVKKNTGGWRTSGECISNLKDIPSAND